jgi:nucleotide-binding universal stress UspA family protein
LKTVYDGQGMSFYAHAEQIPLVHKLPWVAARINGLFTWKTILLINPFPAGDVNLGHEKKCERSHATMNSKRVLIPLDLMRSPCDALIFARNMAADQPVSVTLLYVLNLNIVAPGRQIYDELCVESERALQRLAKFFFGAEWAAHVVVRVGAPHEEIVAEAKAESADLIILSGPERRSWKHLLHSGTTQKIIDASPCPALVLPRIPKKTPPRAAVPLAEDIVPAGVVSSAA